MKTKTILVVFLLLCTSTILFSQSVAINTSGAVANASSILDVASTTSGMLVPRMTTAQRTAIAGPATGLLVYDTNFQAFWYFDGTIWRPLLANNTGWTILGNSGTVNGTNFMGSIDNVSVDFRTNNTIRATLLNTGEFRMAGSGTAASPIYSWTTDPNTGLYNVAADVLGMTTNGIERVRLSTTEAVINDVSADYDFRVESDAYANMIFVDAGNNRIGLNTNAPTSMFQFISDGSAGWVTQWNNNTANGGLKQVYNSDITNGSRVLMGVTNYNGSAFAASAVMGLSLNATVTGSGGIGVTGSANNESGMAVDGELFFAGAYSGWGGYFSADVFCAGTYFGSDRRLKRDIQPLTGALKVIDQIDPVTYYYDTQKYPGIGFDPDRLSYGFIAQDLEKVLPEMVKDKNIVLNANTLKSVDTQTDRQIESFKVVNYSLMIPVLTQAIKEQQIIIQNLEKRISDLEAK